MSCDLSFLEDLISDYQVQIGNLDTQLISLDDLITNLQAQRVAIEDCVLQPLLDESDIFLQDKKAEFESLFPDDIISVVKGSNYGPVTNESNLSDWIITRTYEVSASTFVETLLDGSSLTGSDPDIVEQITRQADYLVGNGHIHDDVGLSGTYGIIGQISNINQGKSILQNNKNKLQSAVSTYSKFL
jgi:hypothetical protein